MTNADRDRLAMSLFAELSSLPADVRLSALAGRVDLDAAVQDRVRRMLDADLDAGAGIDAEVSRFLFRQVADAAPPDDAAPATPDASGGRYRILRLIGEGGMGTVYEAEQISPRRRVAIKAIGRGVLSEQGRRRFEYEAEVLGRLRHPGIAQLYEADFRGAGSMASRRRRTWRWSSSTATPSTSMPTSIGWTCRSGCT